MAASLPVRQGPSELTQRHVAGIADSASAGRLKTSLRRSHPRRSREEINDALQHAYAQALERCEAEGERQVYGWLWRTADRRLCDRGRELAHEMPAAADSNVWLRAVDEHDPQHTLQAADEHHHLVDLFEQLAGELPDRQRSVLALHARGRERRAVAQDLGVSERIVRRSLEQILSRARELLTDRCGSGCEHGTRDVCRLAFGLATGSEAGRAQLHLVSCPTCQAFHERLAWWREAAAAVVPVPAGHQLDPTLAERTLTKLADGALGVKQQLTDAGSSIRQHASDSAVSVKTQAMSTYYRGPDPSPLAAVRPGPAAAVIVSCLTVAGGAYCADQGIDPIRALAGATGGAEQQQQPPTPAQEEPVADRVPDEPATSTSEPAPQPPPAPAPPVTPTPAPPAPASVTPPAPAPPDEFDPASSAAAGSPPASSPAPASAPAPTPAPAASGGGGEFGGP